MKTITKKIMKNIEEVRALYPDVDINLDGINDAYREDLPIIERDTLEETVKNVNRLAHYHLVFAQLSDLAKDPVSEEEQSIADFVWVPKNDVLPTISRDSMKALWNFYITRGGLK